MSVDGHSTASQEWGRVNSVKTPDVIRRRRRELGLSAEHLAGKLGVDVRQIRRYETGESQPTLQGARILARELGITLDELAGGEPTYAGLWWSHWTGLPDGRDKIGAVEITHRGRRVEVLPATDPQLGDGFPWRSEMFADEDSLLGWFVIDDPANRSRGTILLSHIDGSLGGDWVKLSLHELQTGSLALARTPEAAQARLDRVVESNKQQG